MYEGRRAQDKVGHSSVIMQTSDTLASHFPEFISDTESLSCERA